MFHIFVGVPALLSQPSLGMGRGLPAQGSLAEILNEAMNQPATGEPGFPLCLTIIQDFQQVFGLPQTGACLFSWMPVIK